jgi:hypothetical protein
MDDPFFHFTFFLGLMRVAGSGGDPQGPEEGKEGLVVTDEWSVAFEYRSEHIIGDQLSWRPAKETEGVDQAAVQGLLVLGMGELEVKQATIPQKDGKTGELTRGIAVGETAEMAPVNLGLFPWCGLKAKERPSLLRPDIVDVGSEYAAATGIAFLGKPLPDNRSRDVGMGFKHLPDLFPKRIKQTWSYDLFPFGIGIVEVFGNGCPVKGELTCNPVF